MKVEAAKITRQSKSNLALAFISLGRERRRDMTVFYAFCRVIDDIADATDLKTEEKQRQLDDWRGWLREAAPAEAPAQYSLGHIWQEGSWISKAILIVLAIMSAGTWYIFFTKWIEQQRIR